jgi:predicted RNA-binding Zn ribbon-like protein
MKAASATPETLAREELAIRFVNTVAWRRRDPAEERLPSPGTLLKWMLEAKLVDRAAVGRIASRWQRAPREALAFLKTATELREAIYHLFVGRIDGKNPDPRDARVLTHHLAGSSPGLALAASRSSLKWQPQRRASMPEGLLKPIAWSAAGLLMGPRVGKVKQCQDERGCGWLFIDESRAQNRRWCSMGDCGNLAKSRRHHSRMIAG